jgi:hypothetical protein
MRNKSFQLELMGIEPAALEPYFNDPGSKEPLSASEIATGVAGLFRVLGKAGKLSPESALAIARAYSAANNAEVSAASIELVKQQTRLAELKADKLAEELNRTKFPSPKNDYEPTEKPA